MDNDNDRTADALRILAEMRGEYPGGDQAAAAVRDWIGRVESALSAPPPSEARPASVTDPPALTVRGVVESRADRVTATGAKYCQLTVAVRHVGRGGDEKSIRFPMDFWQDRIPVAREGAQVEASFRVCPKTLADGRTFVFLRGWVCRELPPPGAVEAMQNAECTMQNGGGEP